jgi:medium-chain acyl-[acyl-carrier-protein] hydrolase
MTDNPWVVYAKQNPSASRRLFCFPYAGAAAYVYNNWPRSLPIDVEVCALQLPGRGKRLREPMHTRMSTLCEAVLPAIKPLLDKPFMFFGHSMGAMIAVELARLLRRERQPLPSHLFVSGRRAVQVDDDETRTYDLPEAEFIQELIRLNGTPREVLEHRELLELMLPLLRADFELIQTYEYSPEPPFAFPITAFGGLEDEEVSREQLDAWREQTTSTFKLHMLPGDHFFIHSAQDRMLRILSEELSKKSSSRSE